MKHVTIEIAKAMNSMQDIRRFRILMCSIMFGKGIFGQSDLFIHREGVLYHDRALRNHVGVLVNSHSMRACLCILFGRLMPDGASSNRINDVSLDHGWDQSFNRVANCPAADMVATCSRPTMSIAPWRSLVSIVGGLSYWFE